MNNMNLFRVWNQVLWNWRKFMVVYSPFFHIGMFGSFYLIQNLILEALIFRFVIFFHLWKSCNKKPIEWLYCVTGKCSKHRRTIVRFRMNRREQRIEIFWVFSFERANSSCKKGLFIRLLFNKRCEYDDRSKSRSWMSTCQLMY